MYVRKFIIFYCSMYCMLSQSDPLLTRRGFIIQMIITELCYLIA